VNSQAERTRLAWRRTLLAVMVVGGIGAVHLATAGLVYLALAASLLTLIGCVPVAHRLWVLREAVPVATWEPAVLTCAGLLLSVSVLFAR
jgi:uncharacterized membrane protein YidH (DUF202 family)